MEATARLASGEVCEIISGMNLAREEDALHSSLHRGWRILSLSQPAAPFCSSPAIHSVTIKGVLPVHLHVLPVSVPLLLPQLVPYSTDIRTKFCGLSIMG